MQVGIYALDGPSKKHGMLTSKAAEGKVLTYTLQRWKTAKRNLGERLHVMHLSLLRYTHRQWQCIPLQQESTIMETNQFYQPETFRLNCVEVWLYCWWMIYSKQLHRKVWRKGTKGHIRSFLTSVAIAILNIIQEIALGFTFSVLGIKFRASHNIGKHSNCELYPHLPIWVFWITKLEHR